MEHIINVTDQSAFVAALIKAVKENAIDDAFLSKAAAAALLDVHPNTLDTMAREGRIQRYKNGRLVRYKKSELILSMQPG